MNEPKTWKVGDKCWVVFDDGARHFASEAIVTSEARARSWLRPTRWARVEHVAPRYGAPGKAGSDDMFADKATAELEAAERNVRSAERNIAHDEKAIATAQEDLAGARRSLAAAQERLAALKAVGS